MQVLHIYNVCLFVCTQSQSSRAPSGTTQVCRGYGFGAILSEDKQTQLEHVLLI